VQTRGKKRPSTETREAHDPLDRCGKGVSPRLKKWMRGGCIAGE